MNKHLHRIVFNATRACLMAVAETSRAHGKAAAGERGAACTHAAPPVGFHLNRLQWVCWLSIGAVMALNTSPAALAQTVVIADPNAPRNQQPTVLRSGNQTVQVNIQTPNAAGLSRNSYKQFDVMADGVILNNSRTNVSTQLGGWVEANPWLAKGTAKVILNQVNSIHPSLLKGAVEVAGQRADVIIANPAGISVNGATFINSVQVNLTTGTPQFDNNNLTGFQVRGGLVDIDGLGLDTSQTDYTAILGRAVTLNAKVWANDLKIATGLNDLPSDSLIPSTNPNIKPDSNTTAPSFALDVSRLGGMYAGKIQLIGTEAGLGVRNGGSIQASNGPLVVSQDGWISNTGNMLASQQLQIDTTGKFDNSGSVYAIGSLGIQSGDTQTHSGITAALGSVNLQTQGDRKADIISQQHAIIASGLQPDGKLTDAQALTVQANGTVQLAGQTLSLGQLRLQGDSVDVSQGTLSANQAQLIAQQGDVLASASQIHVKDNLNIQTQNALVTDKATITTDTFDLQARTWRNQGGSLTHASDRDLTIQLQAEFDNSQGVLQTNSKQLKLETGLLNNTGGLLFSAHDLDIQTQQHAVINTDTQDPAMKRGIQAMGNVNLNANALNNDKGVLLAGNDFSLTLQGDHVTHGVMVAGRDMGLQTTGDLTNQIAIRVGRNLSVSAQSIDNTVSGELVSGNNTQLMTTKDFTNRGLVDGGHTQINSESLTNLGTGRIYGDRISIAAHDLINKEEWVGTIQKAATIAARNELDIGAHTIVNQEHALIYSGSDMAIAGALDNARRATGTANTLTNSSATIESGNQLTLHSADTLNVDAHIKIEPQVSTQSISEGDNPRYDYTRTITEDKLVLADPAKIISASNMALSEGAFKNLDSKVLAGGQLTKSGTSVENNERLGTKTTHDVGTMTKLNVWHCDIGLLSLCLKGHHSDDAYPWQRAPVIETLNLTQSTYKAFVSLAQDQKTQTVPLLQKTPSTQLPAGWEIRTANLTQQVPNTSLYKTRPETTAKYLVETDPQFTNQKTWLSSDYMLKSLAVDPGLAQKRMGDGYYEQKLIREQVAQLTGRRFIGDFLSDEQQYQALMNNGLTTAKALNLRPGVALTPEQTALLTSDMVWLVEQTITLPDGSSQKVLTPQLYVRVKQGDLDGSGALISADTVNMDLSGDLKNSGTFASRKVMNITADNIRNIGGTLSADVLNAVARQDIDNIGGTIEALSAANLAAERDFNMTTTTQSSATTSGLSNFSQTGVDRVAALYVKNPGGVLSIQTGRDVNLTAAKIDSQGSAVLTAANNLNLGTITTERTDNLNFDTNNYNRSSSSKDVGSSIKAAGDLSLIAGNDLNAKAATVQAGGAMGVKAVNDINILAGEAKQSNASASQSTSSGFLSSTTTVYQDSSSSNTALASSFSGNTVTMDAGHDLRLKGSSVVADTDISFTASNNITIEAAQNTATQNSYSKTTQSGLFGNGGGLLLGSSSQSEDTKAGTTSAAASTVGSLGGNINIKAGNAYKQIGSDVLALEGDVTIQGKNVRIEDAQEKSNLQMQSKAEQSGLSIGLTGGVVSAVQTADRMANAAANSSDPRMKAMAAAATAMAAKDALSNPTPSVSLSLGSSESNSNSTAQISSARGSTVTGKGTVSITATGAGKDSDITIKGSSVKGSNTALESEGKINLLASQNTLSQTNSQNSHSASVGMSVGSNSGFTLSANEERGRGNGQDISYNNARVQGNTVSIKSGSDTNLKGAVVAGNTVKTDIGGNLNIESLQDTSSFKQGSKSVGGSVTFSPAGVPTGGGLNLGKTNIDSNYSSVQEQSGIRAGDGGFQVEVKGKTTLTGGAITSTQAAIDNKTNTYNSAGGTTLTDLTNSAEFKAEGYQVSVGVGSSKGASAGVGNDSGRASSTTTAAISAVAGHMDARTGDKETGIKKIFDADKVSKEINAQITITSEFGKQASKAVETYSNTQRKALQEQLKQATTPEEKEKAQQAIKEVNTQERALNILVGAVSGLGASMATKESLSAVADEMRQLMVEDSKKFVGVVDSTGNVLNNMSGPSAGVNGDVVKLGGTRVDLDVLCGVSNERCTIPMTPDGSVDTKKPVIFTGGKNTDGTPKNQTLADFIATPEGQKLPGATGGIQGEKGTLFGVPYVAGSWQDKLIEAFAGPHDMIGGKFSGLYEEEGNAKRDRNDLVKIAQDRWSEIAILPSAPFAAAQGLPPEVWKAIAVLLGAAK